jgi:hypothetical protein|tara:strand:- start:1587 stop:1778 length:192 start_codon:yes stop_codon:yes gene_type:complete
MKKNTIYRSFDQKGRFQQSYSGQLDGAFQWAVDCAKRTSGTVKKVEFDAKGGEISSEQVYPIV